MSSGETISDHQPPRLSGDSSHRDGGLTPTAITNLAWAYAVLGHRDTRLFAALAHAAVPQKVVGRWDVCWGGKRGGESERYGSRASRPPPSLFSQSRHRPPDPLYTHQALFDPPSLASLAWAFAALGLHDEALFLAISKKASRRIRHFTPEHMSRVSKACGR